MTNSAEISRLLREMNQKGSFQVSVLTDREGFPLAWASGNGENPETQAAVVALAQKTAGQVSSHLGMAVMDEISMRDESGSHLVCRPFTINGRELILAVLMVDKRRPYRKLTNQAVRAIQQAW